MQNKFGISEVSSTLVIIQRFVWQTAFHFFFACPKKKKKGTKLVCAETNLKFFQSAVEGLKSAKKN